MERPCTCSRRDFVRLTVAASAGAGLAARFGLPLLAQDTVTARAKRCILLWLAGGPSQLDTFDPKPGTATGGPFKAIPTAAPGIEICEHLPRLAQRMKSVSLIRTVNSRDPNHDTATYMMHTGYRRAADVEHPHVGSVLLQEMGASAPDLPGCVVIGGDPPVGAGYLSADAGPLVLDRLDNPTEDLGEPPYVNRARLERRYRLLESLDRRFNRTYGDDARVEARRRATEKTYKLLTSDSLKAFMIKDEPEPVRKSYGDTDFGRAALMARRLVQSGVRFVEVQFGDWDTHNDNFNRVKRNLEVFDPAASALIADLEKAGLLDETLVVCMGEFGRTPVVNGAGGRDHFTRAWSVALAGGGIRGGRVVGRTDERGLEVKERPVGVNDLFATIYGCFGVNIRKEYVTLSKRPLKILDGGERVAELF